MCTNIDEQFLFTPQNLIANIDKLGAWSAYGLASYALKHYFPDEYDEDGYCEVNTEVALLEKLSCTSWIDVIIKYEKEVGYGDVESFNPGAVNSF